MTLPAFGMNRLSADLFGPTTKFINKRNDNTTRTHRDIILYFHPMEIGGCFQCNLHIYNVPALCFYIEINKLKRMFNFQCYLWEKVNICCTCPRLLCVSNILM